MILTGLCRLGADADIRYLQDGTAVANLNLAYNYGKKDNEGKRPTQWIKASIWGVRAENSAPYLVCPMPSGRAPAIQNVRITHGGWIDMSTRVRSTSERYSMVSAVYGRS